MFLLFFFSVFECDIKTRHLLLMLKITDFFLLWDSSCVGNVSISDKKNSLPNNKMDQGIYSMPIALKKNFQSQHLSENLII